MAIVVGLLLVGGGGDDDGSSVADPLAVEASAAEAQAQARTAQTAIETYAIDNGGTYGGVTSDDLVGIEPTLEGAALDVTADANTYTVSVTDPVGGGIFSIIRDASGAVSFSCVVAGTTGCPASGDWGAGAPAP